jgi:hypothetical protein
MTWGIPTHLFLQIHVALSLIALVAGLVVLFGLLKGRALGGWTELFLVTIILTSVTGFPLPPFGLDPPRMVGILSLILLAIALLAIYVFRVSGPWRWIFCRRGDDCAVPGRFRRRHSGLCQTVLPARVGADRLGAAVPDRASGCAGVLRRARLPGGAPIPSEDRLEYDPEKWKPVFG